MQLCDKCKLTIVGSHTVCPLCQGQLTGTPEPDADMFPHIETLLQKHHLFIRILFFITAVLVVCCFAANYVFPYPGFWSGFVAAGVGCMWLSMIIVFRKRHNIPKTIVWQAVLFSIFSVIIDAMTGWHRWSLDYAIPCFFIVAILAMWAVAAILRLKTEDFLVYMLIDLLIGVVPVILLCFDLVGVNLPSVLCAVASIISFIALLAFKDKALRAELSKRLHM
ncbi:MAG: DUF6320 domain-containing protein [Angelakisella sp.]